MDIEHTVDDRPTITVGQLVDMLTGFDRDLPVTADDARGWYLNVTGVFLPDGEDVPSLILKTEDNFDTRQW